MPHDVIHEVLLTRERLLAYLAAVRRLARVLPHVVHHVFLSRERLGTILTAVGRLARMASITTHE